MCGRPQSAALLAYLAALRLGHAVAFLLASIDHELLEPPDTGTESWMQKSVQRTHEYGADGHLADALRELLG
jgi:hypothetical protein